MARVEGAVVAGLRALGLPRAPVRSGEIDAIGRPWAGRKQPDCRLVLNGDVMRQVLWVQRQPDDAFRLVELMF